MKDSQKIMNAGPFAFFFNACSSNFHSSLFISQNVCVTVTHMCQVVCFVMVTITCFRVDCIRHISYIPSPSLPLILAASGGISAVFGRMVRCLACSDANVSLLVKILGTVVELIMHFCIKAESLIRSVFGSSDRRHLVACLDSGTKKWSDYTVVW